MSKTPFSRNLKSLRKALGLSQQKLAQEVGLKRSNIASYESGAVEPNATNFLIIACFLEIAPSLLFESELSDQPAPGTVDAATLEQIQEKLAQFYKKTRDAETIAQGFTEYLRLHPDHSDGGTLKILLNILDHLVSTNKHFINQ